MKHVACAPGRTMCSPDHQPSARFPDALHIVWCTGRQFGRIPIVLLINPISRPSRGSGKIVADAFHRTGIVGLIIHGFRRQQDPFSPAKIVAGRARISRVLRKDGFQGSDAVAVVGKYRNPPHQYLLESVYAARPVVLGPFTKNTIPVLIPVSRQFAIVSIGRNVHCLASMCRMELRYFHRQRAHIRARVPHKKDILNAHGNIISPQPLPHVVRSRVAAAAAPAASVPVWTGQGSVRPRFRYREHLESGRIGVFQRFEMIRGGHNGVCCHDDIFIGSGFCLVRRLWIPLQGLPDIVKQLRGLPVHYRVIQYLFRDRFLRQGIGNANMSATHHFEQSGNRVVAHRIESYGGDAPFAHVTRRAASYIKIGI
ncbi:MAG: hypothetical protein BWY09_01652 [Candidatus Hydrogenedentes bacterium ADurb.Bin179]|nr:MAG: hypothetical protein BWY09_01652 [Candidatus Hydrogenedentes bacterium ADurb.Bin179]